MKRIRAKVSYISLDECNRHLADSILIQPKNTPVCENLRVFEVIDLGIQKMREENFILSRGAKDV